MAVLINQRITNQLETMNTDIETSSVRIVLNGLEVFILAIYRLLQVTFTTDDLDLLTKNTAGKYKNILTLSTFYGTVTLQLSSAKPTRHP